MDKKERIKTINRIGDIIENVCKKCEYNKSNSDICRTECNTGAELLELGNRLDPHKEKSKKITKDVERMKVTKENYTQLKAEGKTDKQVMNYFNIDHNKFYRLKNDWGITSTRGRKPSPVVKEVVKEVQDNSRVEELEKLIQQMADENENLTAACEDLEDEVEVWKKQYNNECELLNIAQKRLQEYQELLREPMSEPKDTKQVEHIIA